VKEDLIKRLEKHLSEQSTSVAPLGTRENPIELYKENAHPNIIKSIDIVLKDFVVAESTKQVDENVAVLKKRRLSNIPSRRMSLKAGVTEKMNALTAELNKF
jgi:hypothetical protein